MKTTRHDGRPENEPLFTSLSGPGIDLMDYFAGQALAGIHDDKFRMFETKKECAEWCYDMANAMLAVRESRHAH